MDLLGPVNTQHYCPDKMSTDNYVQHDQHYAPSPRTREEKGQTLWSMSIQLTVR